MYLLFSLQWVKKWDFILQQARSMCVVEKFFFFQDFHPFVMVDLTQHQNHQTAKEVMLSPCMTGFLIIPSLPFNTPENWIISALLSPRFHTDGWFFVLVCNKLSSFLSIIIIHLFSICCLACGMINLTPSVFYLSNRSPYDWKVTDWEAVAVVFFPRQYFIFWVK